MINRSKAIIFVVLVVFIAVDVWVFSSVFKSNKDKSEKQSTYKEAVEEYEKASAEYNTVGLESAKAKFSSIIGYEQSSEYISKIDDEIVSIELYEKGVDAYGNNDYDGVYQCFQNILDYRESMKYVKDMSESILSTADDLIKDEKYDQATKLLLKIPEYMGEYHDQAKQKYSSIEGIKVEKNKARKYQDALKKYDDKDYVAAQTGFMEIRDYKDSQSYLEKIGETLYDKAKKLQESKAYGKAIESLNPIVGSNTWSGYQSALDLKEKIVDDCVNNALSDADKTYHSTYNIDDAVEILKKAEKEIGKDSRLTAAINTYNNDTVVYIADLEMFNYSYNGSFASSGRSYINEYLVSNYQVEYSNSVTCTGGYISYLVSGKNYQRFKAVVGCPEGMHSTGREHGAYIEIIGSNGDNKKVLYTTGECCDSSKPEEVDVDISGYEVIYFQWNCVGSGIWDMYAEFATIYEGRFLK